MRENGLLEQLRKLLTYKKSKVFYSEKLGISVEEVDRLLVELRNPDGINVEIDHPSWIAEELTKEFNIDKGTVKSSIVTDFEPKSHEELAQLHKVDLTKYRISSYWTKQRGEKFTSSLLCTLIKADDGEKFQTDFIEFLKDMPPCGVIGRIELEEKDTKISLILPKQDAHYNKYDISGENSIEKRFLKETKSVLKTLVKAAATNVIDEIVYIVGSDQFNSEWTGLTTKGTPQQNILSHQEAFKAICNHEVGIIGILLQYSFKVKVVFVPGNHDEFVGWHLINWLESYFRINRNIYFDSSTENTKYHKYGNSAIMLNHGDAIKPKELAAKFPMGFKEQWSSCDNFYIFTGDKHTELSLDIHGIKFYQVPQLSTSSSKWDDKQGYTDSKAEMTAFVITENNGMSDILKDLI